VEIAYDADIEQALQYYDETKHFNWCFEAQKLQVYATDLSGVWSKKLRINSHRIYLWKLVGFIKTGRIVKWNRIDKFDYRWPGESKFGTTWIHDNRFP
jgi:hypothetical protein